MLLGTSWELGEHVTNIVRRYCEQQKSKTPDLFTPHPPKKKQNQYEIKNQVQLRTLWELGKHVESSL